MTTRPPNAQASLAAALMPSPKRMKRMARGQSRVNRMHLNSDIRTTRRAARTHQKYGRLDVANELRATIPHMKATRRKLRLEAFHIGKFERPETIAKGLRGWANKRPPGKAMVSSGHPIHRIKLGHYRMGHQGRVRFKGQPIGQVSYKPSTGYSATITTWPVKSTHGHGTAQGAMNAIVGHHQRRMRRRAKVGKSAGFGRYYAALMGEDD